MEGKKIAESRIVLSELMMPEHANQMGNVHGGEIVKMADNAGALAAIRHARRAVVTVAIDSMTFLEPIYVGNLVTLVAELTYVGRSSMEVRVEVNAEDVLTGRRTRTNTAYLVYVALDERGRSCAVPPLVAETDEQRERMERARERQAYRLSQRAAEREG
jgi:uncharacterized protein (TIGR00369 family)